MHGMVQPRLVQMLSGTNIQHRVYSTTTQETPPIILFFVARQIFAAIDLNVSQLSQGYTAHKTQHYDYRNIILSYNLCRNFINLSLTRR